jgi:hypothetical protein
MGVRIAILAAIVALVTGAHLVMAVREHGVTAEAVVPPLLGLCLVAAILVGVLRWQAKIALDPEARSPAATQRRMRWAIGVGVAGALLSGAAELLSVRTRPPAVAAAPFTLEGERVVSRTLGVALVLAAPWSKLEIAPQPGADVAMEHPEGVRFVASANGPERGAKIDPTLELMLAGKRKQYGRVDDVAWTDERVGGQPARSLSFTAPGPNGEVRMKVWVVERGPYWLLFNCGAPAATFKEGERRCLEVLASASGMGAL